MNVYLAAGLIIFVIYEFIIVLILRQLDDEDERIGPFTVTNFIMIAIITIAVLSFKEAGIDNLLDMLKYFVGIPFGIATFILFKVAIFRLFLADKEIKK